MTDEELKEAYQLFTGLWKLVHKHHNTKTDQEWKNLTDHASELVNKHGVKAQPLVVETLNYIERGYKK